MIPSASIPSVRAANELAPPGDCQGTWAYLEQLDEHRYPPFDTLLVLADAAQVVLGTPPHVSIREAIGDLDELREAVDRLDAYEQFQPNSFNQRHINGQLRA